ncbi:hypothetical protein [Olleya sp. Bg11-27]|uniref:hypothetical protein n=1 Tax=Olleya sp. Bg11-27 TaxID=2058135 RepID=UPI000C300002|nr:hypothetical protein [Olleya sp. Bg11-27]AUC76766.1 hypothetical protein CW732_14210 [Olleya sp. Bg11-27]
MKKVLLPLLSLVLVLFSCENEALEGEFSGLDGENSPSSIVGTWALVSFNNTISSTGEVNGTTVESNTIVESMDTNYNMTFTAANTFNAAGNYGYNVNSTVNGQNSIQDLSLDDVNGSGSYTVNGNEMTVNGAFFTLEFQGMDLAQAQGEQTLDFSITDNGQTLTFIQDTTETNTIPGGGSTTAVVTGTSIWSLVTTTNTSCADAVDATSLAENAYNNDTTNAGLCNAYKTALQNQITVCGDANGALQSIIDGLGDCASQNSVLLKKTIWTYGDGSTLIVDFNYDGNRLTSMVDSDGETDTFTYENNLLTRIDSEIYDSSGNLDPDYTLLEYDSQNRVINEVLFINNGVQSQRTAYAYNTDGTITVTDYVTDQASGVESLDYTGTILITNGNVVSWTDGSNVDQYTYDNKNGALKNVFAFDTLLVLNTMYIGNNNETAKSSTIDGTSNPDESYTVSYMYNNDDYPLTSNFDYEVGSLDDYSVQYFYE